MKILLPFVFLAVIFAACHSKKKKTTEPFFPVLSFIRSQVAHVDTSLYSIRKITFIDSTRSDTEYYKREQFRDLATDFLSLPDIASTKYEDDYEERREFFEDMNRVSLSYTPKKPDRQVVQKEEVLISPGGDGDKVKSIIIDYINNNRDSLVEKKMLWQVDESFQVSITRQLPGKPETITIYKVLWNGDENE